ncbi:MAG: Rpp14/Pop5 family protein [Candidatus Methanospirareceae archaeon]
MPLRFLRDRKRYIVFEVVSEGSVEKRELLREIWNSIYSLYGERGASESKLWLVEFDNNIGILCCSHKKVEEVRAALACISMVNGMRVGIRVVRVSGTIKSAKHGKKRKRESKG